MKNKKVLPLIAGVIEKQTGVSLEDLQGKNRQRPLTDARKLLIAAGRDLEMSYAEIGRFLNRHYATMIELYKGHQNLVDVDEEYAAQVAAFNTELHSNYKLNLTSMKIVKFAPEPDLWPEQYTDLFQINEDARTEDVNAAISEALVAADTPLHERTDRQVFTDSQTLVDELKDALYGYEIPFRHTHIPAHYG